MEETKVCTKCGTVKPITEFWITDKERGYRRGPCKECDKEHQRRQYADNAEFRRKAKENSARWQKANPRGYESQRRSSLKYIYGLTVQQWDAMLEAQGGKCALCGSEDHGRRAFDGRFKRFMVDHCHKTGRVRGLLCHTCNVRVGAYEKLLDQIGIHKLVAYLSNT